VLKLANVKVLHVVVSDNNFFIWWNIFSHPLPSSGKRQGPLNNFATDLSNYHLFAVLLKFYNRHFDLVEPFNSSLINLIEGGISHPHFYGDFLKKIKKVKYKSNGGALQNAVSLIAQDFLYKKFNKNILKNTCKLVLSDRTIANVRVLL